MYWQKPIMVFVLWANNISKQLLFSWRDIANSNTARETSSCGVEWAPTQERRTSSLGRTASCPPCRCLAGQIALGEPAGSAWQLTGSPATEHASRRYCARRRSLPPRRRRKHSGPPSPRWSRRRPSRRTTDSATETAAAEGASRRRRHSCWLGRVVRGSGIPTGSVTTATNERWALSWWRVRTAYTWHSDRRTDAQHLQHIIHRLVARLRCRTKLTNSCTVRLLTHCWALTVDDAHQQLVFGSQIRLILRAVVAVIINIITLRLSTSSLNTQLRFCTNCAQHTD